MAACSWGSQTPFLQAAGTAAFVSRHDQLRRDGAPAARARLILDAGRALTAEPEGRDCVPEVVRVSVASVNSLGHWLSYGQRVLTQRSENWFAPITPVKRNWTCYLRTSLPGVASCNASANLACNLFVQPRPPAFAHAFFYDFGFSFRPPAACSTQPGFVVPHEFLQKKEKKAAK